MSPHMHVCVNGRAGPRAAMHCRGRRAGTLCECLDACCTACPHDMAVQDGARGKYMRVKAQRILKSCRAFGEGLGSVRKLAGGAPGRVHRIELRPALRQVLLLQQPPAPGRRAVLVHRARLAVAGARLRRAQARPVTWACGWACAPAVDVCHASSRRTCGLYPHAGRCVLVPPDLHASSRAPHTPVHRAEHAQVAACGHSAPASSRASHA